jgi:hypothetical protein
MAKVDKRWAWLSVPVIVIVAFMCCCGGGGIIYFLIPNSPKVIYTSESPGGDVRVDVTELKKSGAYIYDASLIDRGSNKPLNGKTVHVTFDKQVKWGGEWKFGLCWVSTTEGGIWIGSHSDGNQSWVAFDIK